MPKVVFEVRYKVKNNKKEEYFLLIGKLKELISNHFNNLYFVLKDSKDENLFYELFIFDSEEQFDAFEDNQPEEIAEIMNRLYDEFIEKGSIVYSTRNEL